MSSKLPTPEPGKTKTCFNQLADELLPLLRQHQQLTAKVDALKNQARELARKERGDDTGTTSVEIRGQPNVSVLVTFVANKTMFAKGTSIVDMRRLQGLAGEDVVTIAEDVTLKENVTVGQARREVGDELFAKLFEPVYKDKFNGGEFDAWVAGLKRLKTASSDSAAAQTLELVTKVTTSKEETPRVSGG